MYRYCEPRPPRITRRPIPKGYRGTLATADQIVRLIDQGKRDFCVRQHAIEVYRRYGVGPKDFFGEISALFDWVRRNVRYTRDIHRVELLHSARRLLELKAGDCDDMVILLASMLEATGHPVRLVVVGSNPKKKWLFSHIYLQVSHKGRWLALDPTMNRPVGWEPRAATKKIIPVSRGRRRRARSKRSRCPTRGSPPRTPGPGWRPR